MIIVRKLYLQKIVKEIQVISRKIKQDEEDKKVSAKWKYAAMVKNPGSLFPFHIFPHNIQVMDRFCLVLFVLFTTILSLVIFISAHPNVIVS